MDGRALRRWLCTPWVAAIVLLVLYGGLSQLNDPAGTLGSDTGIKVATLRVMDQRSTLHPGLGYWAAEWDPAAKVHPYRDTTLIRGEYIDVPTLPMLLAAYPLYRLGGYRLALLWPMFGLVACAFLARALASRLEDDAGSPRAARPAGSTRPARSGGSGRTADGDGARDGDGAVGTRGWGAFWLVGLTSPMVLYALDLWEHTLGVAAMGGAVLLLVDQIDRPARWRGLAAGALFGVAFTMRTEALVYATVTFAVVGVVLVRRRRVPDLLATGIGGAVGFVGAAAANIGLELAVVGEPIRTARASGAVGGVASGLGVRAREAVVTLVSPFPSFDATYLLLGAVATAALVALAWWGRRRSTRRIAIPAAAIAAFVVVDRLSLNASFWPGLFATTPIAAAGLALGWGDDRRRRVVLVALLPLPLVFLSQFPGGALPQWGGRYILTTGFLLMVVGASALGWLEQWSRLFFIGLSVLVTAVGLSWVSTRTHQVAVAGEALARRPEAVLVSPDGFVVREFAATYGDKDWLSTNGLAELDPALDVVRRSGRRTFAIVTLAENQPMPDVAGFHRTGTSVIPFVDPLQLTVTSYAADGG